MTVTLGQPLSPDPDEFARLAASVWQSGRWTNGGALVTRFEQQLEALTGWRSVAATASGTSALTVALLTLDLPAGSEVITTPLTFRATALAIEAAGLTPVFAAADPVTLNLDVDAVERAVTARTGAILPVHLFGVAVDERMDTLGFPVVYDAAHAYGFAPVIGRGTASAYSLHATKLLHTGEGGFVATNDPQIAERAARIRNFGLEGQLGPSPGTNAKMPEMSAAVGLATLALVEGEMKARQRVRDSYAELVAQSARVTPHAPGHPRALVLEIVRCDAADQYELLADLAAHGVIARAFPALCDADQRYSSLAVVGADSRRMTELARTAIALPIHGRVTEDHLAAVAEVFG